MVEVGRRFGLGAKALDIAGRGELAGEYHFDGD